MHYLEDHGIDSDYEQDMKLPFKKMDFAGTTVSFIIPQKKLEYNFEFTPLNFEEQHSFAYSESFYPSIFQKIWQPPKI